MKKFNYRLLAHKDGEDDYFQIHEVYYDENGKPESYTKNGIPVGGNDIGELRWVLNEMENCLKEPILSVENFPNEYKK
jgi:hypothetical protein